MTRNACETCFRRESLGSYTPKSAIRRWVFGTEKNALRSVHKPCVRSKDFAREVNDNERDDILEILADDAVVMQLLHAGQHGTRYEQTHQSLVAITG